jgi:GNAT superfamily N-acetyltransferase
MNIAHFIQTIDGTTTSVFLAMAAPHNVLGTATLIQSPGPDVCGLVRLWVREDLRREGIGSKLLDAILTRARTLGYKALSMLVTHANLDSVRSFYERKGFFVCYQFADGDVVFTQKL